VVQLRGGRPHEGLQPDAKLVRSTAIPRSIWVGRIVLSKGIEFAFSIPVLILFAVFAGRAELNPMILLFPVGILLQAVLLVGLGLIVAPLCALWADLERTTRLILRALLRVAHHLRALRSAEPFRDSPSSTRCRASSPSTGSACSPTSGMPRRCSSRQ
jgi:ABC-2 type transport system permease protein